MLRICVGALVGLLGVRVCWELVVLLCCWDGVLVDLGDCGVGVEDFLGAIVGL